MIKERKERIRKLLCKIYGSEDGEKAFKKIENNISNCAREEVKEYFSEKDIFLITYGDSLKKKGEKPLSTLSKFGKTNLKGIFSAIHILPFFPYSSDDGFSVMDYYSVTPELGSWEDIGEIGKDFKLMFDLILNHVSAQSEWFRKYLAGKKGFEQLAIECDPSTDLSAVVRPRTSPLLTPYTKDNGEKIYLWTTFSADQIDLNFKSTDVLEKMIDVLLFYVKQGASIIRLDAIAYLWKEINTPCIHLPEDHSMVKLLRQVINCVEPEAVILTETNVPHKENISYFGNGYDEAQMVYNFTLPPLLLHSFLAEDITTFSDWVDSLSLFSKETTFFNFTASHDGIGIRPIENIISKEELEKIITHVKNNGGRISYKKNPDGSESPYELNITYVDALMKKDKTYHAERFIASQSIAMVLPGVPAVYIHSLLGSHNWNEGVKQTGHLRTINREKLNYDKVMEELNDSNSFRSRVFDRYIRLLKIRIKQPAFHPNASFKVLKVNPKVFSLIRETIEQKIFVFVNVSSQKLEISLTENNIPPNLKDLITDTVISQDRLELSPYQIVWLSKGSQ